MRWMGVCALLAVGCGRSGQQDTGCDDWDGDGVCTAVDQCPREDDLADSDGDGEPDIDERDFLHRFEIPTVIFDSTSSELAFRMGYGQPGQSQASWDDFDPPVILDYAGDHEDMVRTCTLWGWDKVEAQLIDGSQAAYVGLWMEGMEDGEDNFQIWPEEDLDLDRLEGAKINFLRIEVLKWVQEPESTAVKSRWSFYGRWR